MTGSVFLNCKKRSIRMQFFKLGHSCTFSGIGASEMSEYKDTGLSVSSFVFKEEKRMKKVLVVMGSDSDLKVMEKCVDRLRSFEIPAEVRIVSAHRTPAAAEQLAKNAAAEGFGVIIAAAGKAAHLGGVLAAYTTLPVIGVPMATSVMGGMDSLLSIVQMPKGIPVATVAIDGADNAAILAAQMIALSDEALAGRLAQFKAEMAAEVAAKDEKVRAQFS